MTEPVKAGTNVADAVVVFGGRRVQRPHPNGAPTGALAVAGGLAAHTPVLVDASSIRHRPLAT